MILRELPPPQQVLTRRIHVAANNHRTRYDLEALRASIRKDGQLQPVGIYPDTSEEFFNTIWGNSRVLVLKELDVEYTLARVFPADISPADICRLRLVENVTQTQLRPSERARGFKELMTLQNITAKELSEQLGGERNSQATISRHLWLLDQSEEIIRLVDDGLVPLSSVTVLGKLPDPEDRMALLQQIRECGWSRQKVEEEVAKRVGKRQVTPKGKVTLELGDIRAVITNGEALTLDAVVRFLADALKRAKKAASLDELKGD